MVVLEKKHIEEILYYFIVLCYRNLTRRPRVSTRALSLPFRLQADRRKDSLAENQFLIGVANRRLLRRNDIDFVVTRLINFKHLSLLLLLVSCQHRVFFQLCFILCIFTRMFEWSMSSNFSIQSRKFSFYKTYTARYS